MAIDVLPDVAVPVSVRRKRRTRRSRTMRFLEWGHRWSMLVLGVALVAITTSGAAVVYEPEWTRWTNQAAFSSTETDDPISPQQALETVAAAHPELDAGRVVDHGGIWDVSSGDYTNKQHYGVDPGTGEITGGFTIDTGVMGFMLNLHECFLTCEDYPGHVGFLSKSLPVPAWLGYDGAITGGALVLLVGGVILLFAAVSGLVLWFPTVKRWSHWARVRWGRGRYARDFDLHNIVGFVAVPFLLMWGLTGASFEMPAFSNAWHAIFQTEQTPDSAYEFASDKAPKGTDDISLTQAIAVGRAQVGGTPRDLSMPAPDDPTGYFALYYEVGNDGYHHSTYPGATAVYVDRHDPTRFSVPEDPADRPLSSTIWDQWRYGMFHYGYDVNGWWRSIWFLFGLTPLLLMWTGVSTWLYSRGSRKRRRLAAAARTEA